MKRWIAIAFTVIVTSFYFFPFEFRFLPGINTKMILAGIGLISIVTKLARKRDALIDKDFFTLSILALVISFIGIASTIINQTHDYTYASYIISMLVWSAGGYTAVSVMKLVHNRISVEIVCNYLIIVCVLQCITAVAIDRIPAFEAFVNSLISGLGFVDLDRLNESERLYGIGASLDVAGSRFSAIIIMIAYLAYHSTNKSKLTLYLTAFIVIAIIGNMMSRTTTVGIILAIVYIIWESRIWEIKLSAGMRRILISLGTGLLLIIPIITYLYNTDANIHYNLRFAFEGFFSLAEKGEWDVHSNEILKKMYVFPDNAHTWIIGDGYMENPSYTGKEPYYIGPKYGGYYKATDVGYLRFIYYFGIIGLAAFCYFMFKAGKICMDRFTNEQKLFIMLLAVHFTVWLKVSTDIFLVFAIFLSVSKEENDEYNLEKNQQLTE